MRLRLVLALVVIAVASLTSVATSDASQPSEYLHTYQGKLVEVSHVVDGRCYWGVGALFSPYTPRPGYVIYNYVISGPDGGGTFSLNGDPLWKGAIPPGEIYVGFTGGGGGPAPCGPSDPQQGGRFPSKTVTVEALAYLTAQASTTTTTTLPGHIITGTINYYYAEGDSFARAVTGGPKQLTPSRETKVEILDSSKSSCSNDVLNSVDTNDSGAYTSEVSSQQKYVCVKIVAQTSYSEIIPVSSSADVTGGAELTDDAYASKAIGPVKLSNSAPTSFSWKPSGVNEPIDQALDIDNAVIAGAQWLGDYGVTPKFVNVLYPYPDSETTNFNPGKLLGEINQEDAFDWGVLLHEYGHFVASQIGVFNNTRLKTTDHSLTLNMANTEGSKAQGLAIAWNEGFADFFSQMVQIVMGTGSLGLTDVGGSPPIYIDYTPTEDVSFPLGVPGNTLPYPSLGEDNEASVARVLWYLYSQPMYTGVEGSVAFVKTLANAMAANDARTLYGAASALLAAAKATPWVPGTGIEATNEEVPANFNEATSAKTYGVIFSGQNVGPTITASGVSGKSITLTWTAGQPSSAEDALNVFLVQFFNSSWTTLLSEQTVVVSSGTKDKMDIFTASKVIPSDWPKGNINAVVLGWNSSSAEQIFEQLRKLRAGTNPLTGPYISTPVSINIG